MRVSALGQPLYILSPSVLCHAVPLTHQQQPQPQQPQPQYQQQPQAQYPLQPAPQQQQYPSLLPPLYLPSQQQHSQLQTQYPPLYPSHHSLHQQYQPQYHHSAPLPPSPLYQAPMRAPSPGAWEFVPSGRPASTPGPVRAARRRSTGQSGQPPSPGFYVYREDLRDDFY